MPLTATLYVVPLPVTVPVSVPAAVPPSVTSPVAKPVTGSLKTTVKLIGERLVGIGLAGRLVDRHRRPPWRRRSTVLSVLVEARFGVPRGVRAPRRRRPSR